VNSGSFIYNYKEFFSTVFLAVADSNCRFIFVDGSYGKCSDSRMFKNSALSKRIQEITPNIPPEKPLDGTCCPSLSYMFVGDEAFGLSTNCYGHTEE
jgi:hypothetical protein